LKWNKYGGILRRFNDIGGFIGTLVTLTYGSLEGARHKEIMMKLNSISQEIFTVTKQLEHQTYELKHEMRRIQRENSLAPLIRAASMYEKFSKAEWHKDFYAEKLYDLYKSQDIENSVILLEMNIRDYVKTSMENHGNCPKLLDEETWLVALLIQVKGALGIGCARYAHKVKGYGKEDGEKINELCKNLQSILRIQNIENNFDDQISTCDENFAENYSEQWISRNIGKEGQDETRDKIANMLDSKFSQFHYMLIVYSPVTGYSRHTTNFDIQMFRHNEKNIAVEIFEPREKNCEEFAKFVNNQESSLNYVEAEQLYDFIDMRLTLFGINNTTPLITLILSSSSGFISTVSKEISQTAIFVMRTFYQHKSWVSPTHSGYSVIGYNWCKITHTYEEKSNYWDGKKKGPSIHKTELVGYIL